MLINITLGKYILKDSIVHKLNPVFKIISLIIIVLGIFFIDSYTDVLMLGSYILLTMLYSDIKLKEYIRNLNSIKILLPFILVVELIFFKGMNNIIFDLSKLVFIILYLSILTYTTAMTEIVYAVEKILRPFNKIIPVNSIAMTLTIILRYIPTITVETDRIIKLETTRGINFNKKNIKEKIKNISSIIIPIIVISIKKSKNTIDIMNVRLYNYGKSRTNYRLNKWKYLDTLLLILNILILIIVIFY